LKLILTLLFFPFRILRIILPAVIYILIVGMVSLLLLEFVLRFFPVKPVFDMGGFPVMLDRELLIQLKPKGNHELNNFGFRDDDFHPDKKGKKRILFLGDSFIYGVGLPRDKTIPDQLEGILGEDYEVFNLGVSSYGPDQSFIYLGKEGFKLKPDAVILSIFSGNDYDDLLKNRIFDPLPSGKMVKSRRNFIDESIPSLETVFLFKYIWYRYVERKEKGDLQNKKFGRRSIYEIFEILAGDFGTSYIQNTPDDPLSVHQDTVMRNLLMRYRDLLASKNIPFMVVVIPPIEAIENDALFKWLQVRTDRYTAREELLRDTLEDLSIPYVDMTPIFLQKKNEFRIYNEGDHHLTAESSRLTSALTASRFRRVFGEGKRSA